MCCLASHAPVLEDSVYAAQRQRRYSDSSSVTLVDIRGSTDPIPEARFTGKLPSRRSLLLYQLVDIHDVSIQVCLSHTFSSFACSSFVWLDLKTPPLSHHHAALFSFRNGSRMSPRG